MKKLKIKRNITSRNNDGIKVDINKKMENGNILTIIVGAWGSHPENTK